MSDTTIKQETWVPHEDLSKAITEWAQETELDQLPEEAQNVLRGVFTEGWSACLHHTMAPARDLAMVLLQMIQLGRRQNAEHPRIMVGDQPLELIETLCHKLVGQPHDWQLDDMVDAVEIDLDNPPEDVPDEVLETLKRAKEAKNEN